jgi:hypothetical protein
MRPMASRTATFWLPGVPRSTRTSGGVFMVVGISVSSRKQLVARWFNGCRPRDRFMGLPGRSLAALRRGVYFLFHNARCALNAFGCCLVGRPGNLLLESIPLEKLSTAAAFTRARSILLQRHNGWLFAP